MEEDEIDYKSPSPLAQLSGFLVRLARGEIGTGKTFWFHIIIPVLILQFGVSPNVDHLLFFLPASWMLLLYILISSIGCWKASSGSGWGGWTIPLKVVLVFVFFRVVLGILMMCLITGDLVVSIVNLG